LPYNYIIENLSTSHISNTSWFTTLRELLASPAPAARFSAARLSSHTTSDHTLEPKDWLARIAQEDSILEPT
jgi:hypothetical protein